VEVWQTSNLRPLRLGEEKRKKEEDRTRMWANAQRGGRRWAEVHHIVGTCRGHIAAQQVVFFPIVDTCLSCEDIARQSCAMVPRWRFW